MDDGEVDSEDEHLQTALFEALCTPEPQPEPTPSVSSPAPQSESPLEAVRQPATHADAADAPATQPEETNFEDLFEILRQGFDGDSREATTPAVSSMASSSVHQTQSTTPMDQDREPCVKTAAGACGSRPSKRKQQPRHASDASHARTRPRLNGGHKALVLAPQADDGPPPPEKVADAYRLLDLSLSASRKEVQKKFRSLARQWHPDKASAEQLVRSTRMFRRLQEAKGLILSWLDQRSPQMEESSESFCFDTEDEFDEDAWRPPEVVLGEAGDVMAEFENDGSDSELDPLERDELKAAGVHQARGDSPVTQSSGEESGDEKADTALALRSRGMIRTQDAPLVQATALSHFMSRKSDASKLCSECFKNKVSKGSDLCVSCDQEHRELQKFLARA